MYTKPAKRFGYQKKNVLKLKQIENLLSQKKNVFFFAFKLYFKFTFIFKILNSTSYL